MAVQLVLLGTLLALSLRFNLGWLALVGLFIAGVDLRLVNIGVGWTDVAEVTRAAIAQVLNGGNPYGVGYAVSDPPGSPFAYGPLTLLWYMPFPEPARLELLVSFVVLGLLALRGRPLGLAIYACTPILLLLASDGSNDHSAGLLLLVGLVALARAPRLGALFIGLAIAFKPYALAFVPPLVMWGGLATVPALVLGAGLFWLPALIAWGLGPIVQSLQMAEDVHRLPYYSLAHALQRFGLQPSPEVMSLFRLLAGGATTLAVAAIVRTQRGVILGGTLIFLVTLYTGYWSTFAYLAAIAPVICWYVDDWLGFGERVRWPLDPWGRLTAELDRRWPRRPYGRYTAPGVESVPPAY